MGLVQRAEEGDCLAVVSHAIDGRPGDPVRHAEQVERLRHPPPVIRLAEDSQRLVVDAQALRGLARVDQPVRQAVQAARVDRRIAEATRQVGSFAEERACPRVIALGPEFAEIHQRAPFRPVVTAGRLELAERAVGQATRAIEVGAWHGSECVRRQEGAREMFHGGARRV